MPQSDARPWMKPVLLVAGVYNIAWGAWMILFPQHIFHWLALPPLSVREISFWQCIGMIVGVYGLGYWISASDPLRHWPVILVGWLGKVLGPIGFLCGALNGEIPWSFGWINVFNDLIWWIPFTAILIAVWRNAQRPEGGIAEVPFDEAIKNTTAQDGKSLLEHSMAAPLVLIFLRHFG
ncbi:MAG TPA: alkyl hydroperoxide reductase [Planctomycetota bacterium]|nr:alkyl hydroperoxide reductase [Planctomycetota bacterium]